MKKVVLTLVLITLVAVAAQARGALASANVVTSQDDILLEGLVVETPEGCEDLIHTSGRIHIKSHLTDLGDGNTLLSLLFHPVNAVAVGMESGTEYRGVGMTGGHERTLGPGESFHFVNVFTQVPYIGVQQVLHVIINANGEMTSYVEHLAEPGFSCS